MKISAVEPLSDYRLRLTFWDGAAGIVDLSRYAGQGVFADWLKPGVFDRVSITPQGALAWPGDLDLCADSLYLEVTGKSLEDLFPTLEHVHA